MNFKKILEKTGIDNAVLFTVLGRIIQGGGGLLNIVLIVKFLNKIEQGYFYTFSSILAIQVFFELGLSGIITQFVAHEFSESKIINSSSVFAPNKSISRISSILHFCLKWFSILAVFLFVILILAGIIFFKSYGSSEKEVNWLFPWVIIAFSTSCTFVITPILSFLEGLGKVKDIARLRLIQYTSQITLTGCFLFFNFSLYAYPLANLFSMLLMVSLILISKEKTLLLDLWKQFGDEKVDYKKEIFPFQWRIALSWISGYFMYQLFNPIIFATEGPIVAGQMGLSLAALNGILTVSNSWINTKVPLFSGLIAQKDFKKLDEKFNKTTLQSSLITLTFLIALTTFIFSLQYYHTSLGNRFLPTILIILLAIVTLANQLISALATYLRCHKKEPFLVFSIVCGTATAISIFYFGKQYGIWGIVTSYTFITVFLSLTWAIYIFKTKRMEWHKD